MRVRAPIAGSDRGGERAAVFYALIQTARLTTSTAGRPANVLARINDLSIQNLDQLLPWNWKPAAAVTPPDNPDSSGASRGPGPWMLYD